MVLKERTGLMQKRVHVRARISDVAWTLQGYLGLELSKNSVFVQISFRNFAGFFD